MKKYLLILAAFICVSSIASAQYYLPQNNKWAFGYSGGLDFTSGTPVATTTAIYCFEGCASICNAAGNMMFYTDGVTIWDNTNSVMPSGSAIVSYTAASSTQAALIAPVLNNPNQFYVFSMEDVGSSSTYCELNYCIVDMTLNGGLGDVIASTLGTFVTNKLGEKMTVMSGNSCDLWLVTHRIDSTRFLSYKITTAGIAAPVSSSSGAFSGTDAYGIGHIKGSPDNRHIVLLGYYTANGTELHDFNATTGIVSNCRLLDSLGMHYGAEFSPNSNVLYCDDFGTGIFQYDITAGSAAAIRATRTAIGTGAISGDMKLATNGKIYFGQSLGGNAIDCIPNPNVPGTGCGYISSVVTLPGSSVTNGGLPNIIMMHGAGDTTIRTKDTTLCMPVSGLTLSGDTSGSAYIWSTGELTPTKTTTVYGTYWVAIMNNCTVRIDTIHVIAAVQDTTFKAHDTTLCSNTTTFNLTATAGYTQYLWNTGATTPTITATTFGTFFALCGNGCDLLIDTVHVLSIPFATATTTRDTSYCFPGTIALSASPGFSNYLWQDGSANTVFNATAAGTYYVVASSFCKEEIDSFHIFFATLSFTLGPDVNVCMNYNMTAPIKDQYAKYKWQDGSTGDSYSASRTGLYYLTISREGCVASDTVNVTFFHFTQNIPDTFICKETPFTLQLVTTPPPGGKVLWNDGSTNAVKTVSDSGTYWVYVSKDECQILDTVRVKTDWCNCWHNVPSAFTPNNDGLNDLIKPKIQPGCSISGYQFTIYNRWGELVFTSDKPGAGWDGSYKNQPADIGVYMYSLQFFAGSKINPVITSGSITLIR